MQPDTITLLRLDGVTEGVPQVERGPQPRLPLIGTDNPRLGRTGAFDRCGQRLLIERP
ncbi:hypothetical protein D3C86_1777310 [compost metagenome]